MKMMISRSGRGRARAGMMQTGSKHILDLYFRLAAFLSRYIT